MYECGYYLFKQLHLYGFSNVWTMLMCWLCTYLLVYMWKKQRHKNNNSRSSNDNDINGFCVTPLLLVAHRKFKHATNVWHMRICANEIDCKLMSPPLFFYFLFCSIIFSSYSFVYLYAS